MLNWTRACSFRPYLRDWSPTGEEEDSNMLRLHSASGQGQDPDCGVTGGNSHPVSFSCKTPSENFCIHPISKIHALREMCERKTQPISQLPIAAESHAALGNKQTTKCPNHNKNENATVVGQHFLSACSVKYSCIVRKVFTSQRSNIPNPFCKGTNASVISIQR
ncbi:hypothetical protein AUEXF2481DRAFT_149332 [Aureobasidium subglaciale EXF-2481]|uniref:Uncharacterized protein n=1 Tax=Aureobasidium subglaciale (strain EXF-2481) TaxID=1043005 RepID=A0A074YSD4_AURSE|nr:uncharacterized protein AUEXF2481DRAFT_149332 [Aureobasidium subglaciale EXF-2481]KER00634.1 hypothetical protein AUEXF2481DRAFT_149332 [Aureobasidium subglaciale EXF-2481]